jgi:hypothetical protein
VRLDEHRLGANARASLLLQASTLGQLRRLDVQAANTPAQTMLGGVTYPAQVPLPSDEQL